MRLPFFKKEPEAMAGRGFIPTDRVKELTSKGFSEIDVIDILKKEGFSPEEIDRALTQALKMEVAPPKIEAPKLPALEEIAPPKIEAPEMPETSLPEEYYESYPTEEYLDYIVQERVGEISKKIDEFEVKSKELEKRIEEIKERLDDIIQAKSNEQQQILSKIEAFKEAVGDVNIRMGSLEKAFKETLPALIESVRVLSDLVQRLKREA